MLRMHLMNRLRIILQFSLLSISSNKLVNDGIASNNVIIAESIIRFILHLYLY